MEVILLSDIYSVLKGRELYGLKNDKVKVISEHGEILIVEGIKRVESDIRGLKKKEFIKAGVHRYPVNIKDVKQDE